ncbi:antibiotic ABC transporter ATP-binding protein [Pontibacillus yanchengensis Y32]|uniref:Antibiotic ABC transporter ATP-binding protein n=2 Tax=Pontibacillus yanchengensis TaxID=462910 RepID=A0A0A2TDE6_9BACI|nr:antibiotic ABC transporter ATP-binding protein [Pontibacillus yanchengensis Y32]
MLEINKVNKRFGEETVLQDVDFLLQKGESVLLLGPNGAGKTTLIRIIMDFYRPDTGSVVWQSGKGNYKVGVVLQDPSIIDRLTVKEMIHYTRSLHKNPLSYEEVLQSCGLESQEKVRTENLSIGQKRRLTFSLALVGQPELLLMDEPTAGMDLSARKAFYQKIESLKQQGITILMTTHLLHEASMLGDRVLMLEKGMLKQDREIESITEESKWVRFSLKEESPLVSKRLEKIGFQYSTMQGKWEVNTSDADSLVRWLVTEQIQFEKLEIEKQTMDHFFEEMLDQEGDQNANSV